MAGGSQGHDDDGRVKPGDASTPMKNVSISGGGIFHAHAS